MARPDPDPDREGDETQEERPGEASEKEVRDYPDKQARPDRDRYTTKGG